MPVEINDSLLAGMNQVFRPLGGDTPGTPERLRAYYRRVIETYNRLETLLPAKAEDVLDIGAGIGGIGFAIARWCYEGEVTLHVMEGGKTFGHRPPAYEPFSPDCRPWNNGLATAQRLAECGVKALYTPADPGLTVPADVIVSTRSWGHHYPVAVYLPLVKRSLRPGGRLFLEIRNGTDGIEELEEHFNLLWAVPAAGSTKCQLAAFMHREETA